MNSNGFISARFDFNAFGEKISLGIGLRSIEHGYSAPQNSRQGYGLTETDSSTRLDHTWFRKNENRAGRWTSADPYQGSMSLASSGSFNRYSYVENQPTNFVDPSGLFMMIDCRYEPWTVCTGPNDCETTWYETCYLISVGIGGGGGGGPVLQPIDTGGGILVTGQLPPAPTPQTGKPGTKVPEKPIEIRKVNPSDPRNMTTPSGKLAKIRLVGALILKLLSEFFKTIPVMVNPDVICEEARKEGSPLASSVLCSGGTDYM